MSEMPVPETTAVTVIESLLPGPTRGDTTGTLYPGPAGAGTREDVSTHATIFRNQAQNY